VEGGSADRVADAPERAPVAAPARGIGAAGRWWWRGPRGRKRERVGGDCLLQCYWWYRGWRDPLYRGDGEGFLVHGEKEERL
jgi:hypothetical protein